MYICIFRGMHLSSGIQYESAYSHSGNELTDVELLPLLSLLLFITVQVSCSSLNTIKKNNLEAYIPF